MKPKEIGCQQPITEEFAEPKKKSKVEKIICAICPRSCVIGPAQVGFCGARGNIDCEIVALNYGRVAAIMLDPIEKKPLWRFHPGSHVLSVGSYGCNLSCPYCQNSSISMEWEDEWVEATGKYFSRYETIMPQRLIDLALSAKDKGNIGIAYTYNEPIIGYEYLWDCSRLAREFGLKNILVTNGYCNEKPWKELLPYIDAANIDVKGFTQEFYSKVGGDLDVVMKNVESAAQLCHLELTCLIIPGENDSPKEMESLSRWIASINPEIPLHLSRFFPHYKMNDRPPTSRDTIDHLAAIAQEHLKYVYKGNY
jgi:pyruvate formate lyase activating enzyme